MQRMPKVVHQRCGEVCRQSFTEVYSRICAVKNHASDMRVPRRDSLGFMSGCVLALRLVDGDIPRVQGRMPELRRVVASLHILLIIPQLRRPRAPCAGRAEGGDGRYTGALDVIAALSPLISEGHVHMSMPKGRGFALTSDVRLARAGTPILTVASLGLLGSARSNSTHPAVCHTLPIRCARVWWGSRGGRSTLTV